MNLVADASVAVKWYVPEAGFEEAGLVLAARADRIELCAPDIFVAETVNALMRKVRVGQSTAEQARAAADHLRRLAVPTLSTILLMDRALRLSLDLNHGFHDCLYLACAEHEDAVFVTADDRLARKATPVVSSARIVGLDDMPAFLASLDPNTT